MKSGRSEWMEDFSAPLFLSSALPSFANVMLQAIARKTAGYGAHSCPRRRTMAEIKSTIDLIMERTKNLSASPEEREAYQRQELEKNIRGLIQRLFDYNVTLDDVKDELEREKKNGRAAQAMASMKGALAAHVDPEADNERLFRIINELVGTPEERLRETLAACRQEAASWKADLAERRKKDLESKGITGPAVLPNLEADPQWKAWREESLAACSKRFFGVINN